MSRALIGRTAELEQITELLREGDGAAAAVVVGEPGIGKSTLLAAATAGSGLPVLGVIGYEPERLVPLAAASGLLRSLAETPGHGPALDELAFRAPGPIEPLRVFEAANRALAEAGPALLLVDDVQWVDELSLALVHYVLRAAGTHGTPLRLLAAGRRVERSIAFAEDVARLVGDRSALIELRSLGTDDARALALSLDPSLAAAEVAELCGRSEGVPFWIVTLVRTRGAPTEAGRLLTGRLRDAGADAAGLLALLAVVARPVDREGVAILLGWPAERVDAATEDLVSRGVATRAPGSIRLAHDLLREAAYAEIPARRRSELHAAVAGWLEETAADELSLLREALEHRSAAGEEAVALASRLATAPQRSRLGVPGLALLDGIARDTEVTHPEWQGLRAGVAALASELGDHRLALEHWSALAPTADAFEPFLAASKAALELGPRHVERAEELLAEASSRATSDEEFVAALAHEARIVYWLRHRTADGAMLARAALARSASLPRASPARLEALRAAYQAAMQEDDGEEMLRLAEEMLVETRTGGGADQVEALGARARAQLRSRPVRESEASFRAAWELAVRRVLPRQAVQAGLGLAETLHDRGRLEEAERVVADVEPLAVHLDEVGPGWPVVEQLAFLRGTAGSRLEVFAASIEREADPHLRIVPRRMRAQSLARMLGGNGRVEVTAELRRAREDADAAGCPRCAAELQAVAAATLAQVGCRAEAEAELAAADATPPRDARSRHVRGQARALVAALSDPSAAAPLLEEVCRELERLDRRVELLWTRIELARALAPTDRPRAAALLREVAAEADAIGSVAHHSVAERELRRLGVRTWRRSRTSVAKGDLSDREREIAQLVAEGASNPEIAEALFLSRKTIERHVSNVLAKVGARNRAELAALLAREGEGAPR